MTPPRYSVRAFLIGIAVLAASFGALESNSELVTSLVYSLHLALLSLAALGALVAIQQVRRFWIGYAVFSGLYSLAAFGFLFPAAPNNYYPWMGYTRTNERPQLITTRLLDLYASVRVPRSVGDRVTAQWSGGGFYPATIVSYKDGRYEVDWDDSSPNEWVSIGQIHPVGRDLERVGHSIFSLLFGFLGGLVALCCFDSRLAASTTPPVARSQKTGSVTESG